MPRVHVLATGGTIASRIDPETGAAVPAVGADELVDSVPELADVAEVTAAEIAHVNSWDMTPALGVEIAAVAAEAFDEGADGVVVTHGTDTLEETVFVLELLRARWDHGRPLVVTGAMRRADAPGADGPANLMAAATVAVSPQATALGAVAVLAGEVHAAREVTKGHTTAVSTFVSPDTGPLGWVDAAGVVVRWRPPRLPSLAAADLAADVRLLTMASGDDGALLDAARAAGARGLVVAGTGTGNVNAAWQPRIAAAIEDGVPVVMASRCAGGRTVAEYGGEGGGATLADLGVVAAAGLSGPKARLALMALLAGGAEPHDVAAWFAAADQVTPDEPSTRERQH